MHRMLNCPTPSIVDQCHWQLLPVDHVDLFPGTTYESCTCKEDWHMMNHIIKHFSWWTRYGRWIKMKTQGVAFLGCMKKWEAMARSVNFAQMGAKPCLLPLPVASCGALALMEQVLAVLLTTDKTDLPNKQFDHNAMAPVFTNPSHS
jgi:hypothetical protein